MPKIIEIGQCFTELVKKNNSGMFCEPRYIEGNTVFSIVHFNSSTAKTKKIFN